MRRSLDSSRSLAVIVIGRAGMDLYPVPDGTKTEAAQNFAAEVGGSAGNIAVAVARQGLRSALLSPLSDDPVGRFVHMHLARYGVDTSRCRWVTGDFRTSLALCETRAEDCEVVIYRNNAADFQLQKSDVDAAFIGRAAVLIVTGTALAAEPSRGAAIEALTCARTTRTFSILDIDYRPYSWPSRNEATCVLADAARRCNAVVGNEEEFSVMAGSETGLLLVADRMISDGCEFAILKKGMAGAITVTSETTFRTGVYAVKAKKPFGSGDAFVGTLVAGLLGGISLKLAVERAAAAAAYVVSRRGCAFAMPTVEELESFIVSNRLE